jgi:hypothetical protein
MPGLPWSFARKTTDLGKMPGFPRHKMRLCVTLCQGTLSFCQEVCCFPGISTGFPWHPVPGKPWFWVFLVKTASQNKPAKRRWFRPRYREGINGVTPWKAGPISKTSRRLHRTKLSYNMQGASKNPWGCLKSFTSLFNP